MTRTIQFTVNGRSHTLPVDPRKSLLEVLREDLGLTGSKKACGVGECGACTVLINGQPLDSCIYLALWADGKEITTIEGIGQGGLSPLQEAFIDKGAVQCGFCTPGFILSGTALLQNQEGPLSREQIRRGISGNLCRCTGYHKIVDAIEELSS